jgi:hypothetical protein
VPLPPALEERVRPAELPFAGVRFRPLDGDLVLEDGVADDLLLRASRAVCRAARSSPCSERPMPSEPAPFVAVSTLSSLAMFRDPFLRRHPPAKQPALYLPSKRNGSEPIAVAGAGGV